MIVFGDRVKFTKRYVKGVNKYPYYDAESFDDILCNRFEMDKGPWLDGEVPEWAEIEYEGKCMLRDAVPVPYNVYEKKDCNLSGIVIGHRDMKISMHMMIEENPITDQLYPDFDVTVEKVYVVAYGPNVTARVPEDSIRRVVDGKDDRETSQS